MAKHQRGSEASFRLVPVYDMARQRGAADRAAGRPAAAVRHLQALPQIYQMLDGPAIFLQGYAHGHEGVAESAEEIAYDQEYRQGLSDAAKKRSPSRHSEAYDDGHQGRLHRHGRLY